MKAKNTQTVVFITGAFVHHSGWDQWKTHFEAKGYQTLAPAWPHKNATVKVLRDRQPNDIGLAELRLSELIAYYADIVKQLPEKPILIGHSLGGLVVQKLIEQDLGVAGIAIHSVPPQGVLTGKFSFYKATWKPLGFFSNVHKTHLMSLKEWQYAFTNGLPLADQVASYEQFAIPESKRTIRDGLTSMAKIDFKKPTRHCSS